MNFLNWLNPVVALALAALAPTPGAAQDVFKIGAALNLTGNTAQQGVEFQRGLDLAAKQWNEVQGGILGTRVEIVAEDHGAQPARAVTAAQKLIQVDRVNVIANVYTSPVLAVMPIVEKANVLQISAGATSPRLVNVSKRFMTNLANGVLEVDVALAFARKKLGITRMAIVYGNDDFGTATQEAAVKTWARLGGTITGSEGTEPTRTDLAALAAKLAAGKPEAVYVALGGGNLGAAAKKFREVGISVPLLGQQGFEAPEMLSIAGSAADNSYFTSAAALGANAKADAFNEVYKRAYGKDSNVFAKNHYDLAMSTLEAARNVKKSGKPWTAENIRAAMIALGTYTGVLGSFAYQEDGTVLRALDIKTFKDGKSQVFLTAQQLESEKIFAFGGAAGK